jgi:hypothetical protein
MAATKAKSSSGRRVLLAGGNWIIDQVKLIDVYPQREQLANILSQSQGTGGAPYNVLIDLAKLPNFLRAGLWQGWFGPIHPGRLPQARY